jgi:protein-disulfide isomerase
MTPPEIPDWTALAEEAGVRDLAEFEACISLPESEFPRIASGSELGRRTGVRGTPTAWVNGRVTGARDFASFEQALRDL